MQKGIVDLEKMFSDAQGDLVVLRQLRAELKHRKLARAFTLLKKVEASLAEVQQRSGTEIEPTEKSVVSGIDDAAPSGNSNALGERNREIGSADVLIYPSPHGVTDHKLAAGGEGANSRSTQRSPISLTLEESFRVLGVAPASSWEVVEQARRTLVERSRPDLVAELSEGQREKVQTDAHRANQAYAILASALMNSE